MLSTRILCILLLYIAPSHGFSSGDLHVKNRKFQGSSLSHSQSDLTPKDLREEANDLLSRARKLREEIGDDTNFVQGSRQGETIPRNQLSSWSVKNEELGDEYRLYVDIGREEGTWMDRRWGASGRRIPFTIDVKFLMSSASTGDGAKMVKDNFMGESSESFSIATAGAARLRGGFDKMNCAGGCYRIDSSKGKDTVRFYLEVDGTSNNQDYGCVEVQLGFRVSSLRFAQHYSF